MDLSRLIIHLLINGIDNKTVEYFDLESIKRYIPMVEKILKMEDLELDGINDNICIAINWLVNNTSRIFEEEFELFEFHLGLMKEFLQISYRFDTIPPNKRALALIAAHKCMLSANNNL